jgi:epoxyqueuosine reductase
VTTPERIPEALPRLKEWVARGYHGSMTWMAERVEERGQPKALWPDVQSIVMLGMNYAPEGDALATLTDRQAANISVYARNRDYHDVVKGALKRLAQEIVRLGGGNLKVFVDTAPVMERALAEAAGLGWQGKHTVLISREAGSWLFLGAIYLDQPLPADIEETDHCGSCRRCLDICPTNAFPAPYLLDARRCISYLTIEHAGPIPRDLRPLMGNRIYGCDDCLAVCPWNKFASAAHDMKFRARPDLEAPRLATLAALDDAAFRALFAGSPVKRIGRDRFIRNVMIAIGNSGDGTFARIAANAASETSALVRGAAIWALWRIAPSDAERLKTVALAHENDATVRAEWMAGAK